ncbi:hypothetical protein BBBOND_0207000 [Babesia bigemina]|uniref:Dolichol phosphate-mannose biosynthesis regulatory protein n=1 Tax=Babesia bigemina TaxID=5866 RepID=A0A061D699_BABBI|nr:hypothetical protein BBBOND_0207000 [Babesia bigemina]CDR95542.1 hypothetical protein BBBOND_0207000 [Babesia bigemina]|eukprot:XP_012767728.1 hypothetical protein BBBOND_0207000 [Babesia bigemina]
MSLSTSTKSRIALCVVSGIAVYLLNYVLFRPIVLTSDVTSTYYLDSIKVSAAVTGAAVIFLSTIGLALGWCLLSH